MALPTGVQRNVFDSCESAQRELDTVLGRLLGGRDYGNAVALAPYGVDIREDVDHLYVEAELPGFKKEEVDITLENQTLTITAQRSVDDKEQKKGEWLLNERRNRRFVRSFKLPQTVSDQHVDANLADGVLTVTLNKREESKPRKIPVS